MNPSQDKSDLLTLLDALCDQRLEEREFDDLQEMLRDDAAAQETYFEYFDLHLHLHDVYAQNKPDLTLPVASAASPGPTLLKRISKGQLSAGLSTGQIVGLTVGLLAATVLAVLFFALPPLDRLAVASVNPPTITHVSGSVMVRADSGKSQAAVVGMKLSETDLLETQGSGALAVLAYEDGTEFSLMNDSAASYLQGTQKKLKLHNGIASADVTPQPANFPMLFLTPNAEIEVVGTRFAMATAADRTELNVATGRVKLTRVSDGKSVEVRKGEGVSTQEGNLLTVRETAARLNAWDVRFEAGMPDGWLGKAEMSGLPEKSKGGVSPVTDSSGEFVTHLISTREEWVNGLFQVQENSHLYITMKMDRPNWLNIFFSARTSDATNPRWALYNFNEVPFWPPKPGEWRTLVIPLDQFRRKRDGVFHDEPPDIGEVVYGLSISSTGEKRGLVIDRIWVTADGPNAVTWQPLNGDE